MAEEDLGLATDLLSRGSPYLNAIGFHAEQAAERLLKACLVRYQVEFPKTHNLGELLDLVDGPNPGLARSLRGATALNPYAVEVRYPGDLPEMTEADAREAVRLASSVREAAVRLMHPYIAGEVT
jgi:HEPN domain-containing protein